MSAQPVTPSAQPAPPPAQTPTPQTQGVPPEIALVQMVSGYWVSQAIYAAARLGLADLLDEGPRTADELAAAAGAHPESLYRLLRALSAVGVFAEEDGRRFRQTPLSAPLRSAGPGSARALTIHLGEQASWHAWGNLLHSIETGETAFAHTHGEEVFPYYAAHPESSEPFHQAMTEYSAAVAEAVRKAYDFSAFETIVDIGGGHGHLLASLLKANAHARGVVFDQPEVVEGARAALAAEGLEGRCEAVGGDFFESVPEGDAYVLKSIIHDWDDERSVAILRNVNRAMKDGGRLLLVETCIAGGDAATFGKLSDLHMMVMTGGRERTAEEFAELFRRSGFRLTRVIPTETLVSIVEAVKDDAGA